MVARAWRASRFRTPSPVWDIVASVVARAWQKSMRTAKRRLQQEVASSIGVSRSKRFMCPLDHQQTMALTLGTPTKSWKRSRAALRQWPLWALKEKRPHPSIISTVAAQERWKTSARSPRASISWTARRCYGKPWSRLPLKNRIQVSQVQSGNAHALRDWTCETCITLIPQHKNL